MEGMKSGAKALLPLADLRVKTHGGAMKDAAAYAAARRNAAKPALAGAYYRSAPSLEYHRNRLLSGQQEQKLVWALQAFSHCSKALTQPLCNSLAFRLFGAAPSERWPSFFMKRRSKELKPGAAKQLSKARNDQKLMIERIDAILGQLESFLNAHNFPSHAALSYDEAALALSGNKLALKRFSSKSKSRLNSELAREPSLGSMISFAQASGKAFMPVYALKESFKGQNFSGASFEIAKNAHHLRGHARRCYAWSDAGRLNAELFGNIMDICYDNWKREHLLRPG